MLAVAVVRTYDKDERLATSSGVFLNIINSSNSSERKMETKEERDLIINLP